MQLRDCESGLVAKFRWCTLIPLSGAGPMQAPGLFDTVDKRGKYGLVHNIGIGGAAVVSLLRRPEFYKSGEFDGRSRYDWPKLYIWDLADLKQIGL